jgi:hypothetical protein
MSAIAKADIMRTYILELLFGSEHRADEELFGRAAATLIEPLDGGA